MFWKGYYFDILISSGKIKVGLIYIDVQNIWYAAGQMLCCFVSGAETSGRRLWGVWPCPETHLPLAVISHTVRE